MVLILTFLSTAFTGIQTVKAFLPSSPPASTDQTSAVASQISSTSRVGSVAPSTTVLMTSAASQTLFSSTYSFSATAAATTSPLARSSGTSSGEIAGIVVGTVLGVSLIIAAAFIALYRWRRLRSQEAKGFPRRYDAENTAKPSYAFSPSSDLFSPPRRQFTQFSGSTDASAAEEIRAQYVRFPSGPESAGQLPRTLVVTL
jgi:hypothetical protein